MTSAKESWEIGYDIQVLRVVGPGQGGAEQGPDNRLQRVGLDTPGSAGVRSQARRGSDRLLPLRLQVPKGHRDRHPDRDSGKRRPRRAQDQQLRRRRYCQRVYFTDFPE